MLTIFIGIRVIKEDARNVTFAKRASLHQVTLRNTREFTREKNLMNVRFVIRDLLNRVILIHFIEDFTLEIDLMNVTFAKRNLRYQTRLIFTKEFTIAKNLNVFV